MSNMTPNYTLKAQSNYGSRKTRAYAILKQMAVQAGYSEGTEGFDAFCDDWNAGKIKTALAWREIDHKPEHFDCKCGVEAK